ncbi:MAG: hypothetical protein MUC50_22835 [Myxococcota bacterium]|nr:hypothetical protein [Myxococcota bacterium]
MSEALPKGDRAKVQAAAFAVLAEHKASTSMNELVASELQKGNLEAAVAKTRKMANIFLGSDVAAALEAAMRGALGPHSGESSPK